jgi:Arc/MetJ-type ribon-helix-helix transcriptional regulator
MKTLTIELSETLAAELEELVAAGWFTSEDEIGRLALKEIVRWRPSELQERFQREDVAWAAAQKAGAATYPERRGERQRFVEAVEEGLAGAEAGRVISDEKLGAWLDEELGPLEIGDLEKRLWKDRPMTTVSLRMPEDVVDDLKHLAPRLGFTSYQALIRAYVGQGLRQHLGAHHDAHDPSERQATPSRPRGSTVAAGIVRKLVAAPPAETVTGSLQLPPLSSETATSSEATPPPVRSPQAE